MKFPLFLKKTPQFFVKTGQILSKKMFSISKGLRFSKISQKIKKGPQFYYRSRISIKGPCL